MKLWNSNLDNSDSPLDYNQVLPQVERIQFPLGYVWGVAGHLNGVKNGDELRAAYEENQPKVVQSMTKFSQSKALYHALEQLQGNYCPWMERFEEMQKARAVENSLLGMKLGGVGLEGEDKERFNDMKMRLAELSTNFSNNVLDATKAFSLTIDDASKVQGSTGFGKGNVGKCTCSTLEITSKGWRGNSRNECETRVLGELHSTCPVILQPCRTCPIATCGRQIYRASLTRASEIGEGDKNNIPLIYEILKLKQEMSKLLGFENYAATEFGS